MLIGRWPSGAPILRVPGGDDPALGDDDFANNHFIFDDDTRASSLRSDPRLSRRCVSSGGGRLPGAGMSALRAYPQSSPSRHGDRDGQTGRQLCSYDSEARHSVWSAARRSEEGQARTDRRGIAGSCSSATERASKISSSFCSGAGRTPPYSRTSADSTRSSGRMAARGGNWAVHRLSNRGRHGSHQDEERMGNADRRRLLFRAKHLGDPGRAGGVTRLAARR